jgi:hypothetical protein
MSATAVAYLKYYFSISMAEVRRFIKSISGLEPVSFIDVKETWYPLFALSNSSARITNYLFMSSSTR